MSTDYEAREHKLFVKTRTITELEVYIRDFDDATNTDELFHKIRNASKSEPINFYITSPGGYCSELLNFKNILVNERKKIDVMWLNHGYSCGAMIFTFTDKRVIYEDSEIMFHTFGHGIYAASNHINDRMESYERTEKLITKTMEPFFTKQEIEQLKKGKEFWLGAEEMLKRGLATHIQINGELIESKDYLKKPKKK